MEVVKKKFSISLIFILISGFFTLVSVQPSLADDSPRGKNGKVVKGPKCQTTDAAGRAPTEVMAPERVLTPKTLKRTMRTIVLDTNCGEIVIEPFHDGAPMALTAIRALIRGGYYDETLCHRLTTEGLFVLQCGDPTASGYGGPNFTFGLENLPENRADNYPAGIVAMANSGRPPVNGSQFFFVYEDTTLAPSYTIWGRVIKGFDIIKMIAKAGTKDGSNNGMPKQTIAIERALIR